VDVGKEERREEGEFIPLWEREQQKADNSDQGVSSKLGWGQLTPEERGRERQGTTGRER